MLAKLTAKNQLTLPKAAVEAVGASEYFDVAVRDGQILLTPVRIQRGDAVRAKLAALGLGDADVAAAVAWARGPAKPLQGAESPGGYGDKGAKTRQRTRRKPAARP